MDLKEIPSRVADGVRFLDLHESVPKDWRTKIDCRALDLEDANEDILGQLFGDYWSALKLMDIGPTYAESIGLSPEESEGSALTDEWVKLLGPGPKYKVGDKFTMAGVAQFTVIAAPKGLDGTSLYALDGGAGLRRLVTETDLDEFWSKMDSYEWVKPDMLLTDVDRKNFFKVGRDGELVVWNLHTGKNAHLTHWVKDYGKLCLLRSYSGSEML